MLAINVDDRHSCSRAAIQSCVPLALSRWQRAQHACPSFKRPGFKSGEMDANHLVRSRKEPTSVKVFQSSPPGPKRHDRTIQTADPTSSQTPHTPLFTPSTSVARPVLTICPQTPRTQQSDSWSHPLTDTAHSASEAAHLRCTPDPPHLPPDATISVFWQLGPPPHRHRTLRFSSPPSTSHAWSTPPVPRRHDRSIRAAGLTRSHTPRTLLVTPPTFIANLGHPTCPQTLRSQHSDSWPHPLTHTANAAFDAAHLRCTPG